MEGETSFYVYVWKIAPLGNSLSRCMQHYYTSVVYIDMYNINQHIFELYLALGFDYRKRREGAAYF
jgi:hypothetical protein